VVGGKDSCKKPTLWKIAAYIVELCNLNGRLRYKGEPQQFRKSRHLQDKHRYLERISILMPVLR